MLQVFWKTVEYSWHPRISAVFGALYIICKYTYVYNHICRSYLFVFLSIYLVGQLFICYHLFIIHNNYTHYMIIWGISLSLGGLHVPISPSPPSLPSFCVSNSSSARGNWCLWILMLRPRATPKKEQLHLIQDFSRILVWDFTWFFYLVLGPFTLYRLTEHIQSG